MPGIIMSRIAISNGFPALAAFPNISRASGPFSELSLAIPHESS
jgi:hypothetical protein